MKRIVEQPLTIDFHIHSVFSKYKDDYELVKENNENNISVLVNNLRKNKIESFAITDHDYFSYSLYKKFKQFEENGVFKKIFPGVEFSIGFQADDKTIKQVHVICIFDDENDEKVKNIESVLKKNILNNKIMYKNGERMFFTETKLISMLKDIDLSFVAIAHQKNSLKSKNPNGDDVSCLGTNKFKELVQCDYFDVLEFKNLHNGMFNRLFAQEFNVDYECLRFITGSDCHEWSAYPKRDSSEINNEKFRPTYLKCLPSFRGLSMAFSDETRIYSSNNIFTKSSKILEEISLKISDVNFKIPLSKGINVFIGDNSIGKSLLFHKLTNYSKLNNNKLKNGYNKYLESNKFEILSSIPEKNLYCFDSQGHIREMFANNAQDNSTFLDEKFPPPLDVELAFTEIDNEIQKFIKQLESKFEYDNTIKKLCDFVIPDKKVKSKNISTSLVAPLNKNDINKYAKIKNFYSTIYNKVKGYENIDDFDADDLLFIEKILNDLSNKVKKYEKLLKEANKVYSLKERINHGINGFREKEIAYKTDVEENEENYADNKDMLVALIPELLKIKENVFDFEFNVEEKEIMPSVLEYSKYKFIKRFKNYRKLSNEYLQNLVISCLKPGSEFPKTSICNATDLISSIKTSFDVTETNVLNILKNEIRTKIKNDLENELAILTDSKTDLYSSLSSGMDSTIYFNIISDDKKEGIYMIDQPEDDVSQTRIKTSIIKDLKKMSKIRQVLLITHNPQFVVNLDADNVISIFKENNKICIHYGALEYKDDKTDILDDVANGLEGGIDSIRKRWKRYEKRISAK